MNDDYNWIVGWVVLLLIAYAIYRAIKYRRSEKAEADRGLKLITGPEARAWRSYALNMALALVPDLLVCWAAAHLTNSGWIGFIIAFVGLQAIYFLFWFKTAVWVWLLFWIYRKQQMATSLENFFIDNHFPVPSEYTTDLGDYFFEISNNQDVDANTRVKAAVQFGTLDMLKAMQRFSLVLQLNSAGAVAMKRYTRLANRLADKDVTRKLDK